MATTSTNGYQDVRDELGAAIRRHRHDCPPVETARLLLSYDGPGQALVGLRYDGRRAVYFDDSDGSAVAVGFDADGLDDRGGVRIARLRSNVEVERWIDKTRYYWGWRHPRFA